MPPRVPCPPPAAPTAFDLRNAQSCAETLHGLLQAYYRAISGHQRVTVRFQERWTEYGRANVAELKQQYITLYRQCPQAATAGLPDLNLNVRRGPPSRGFNVFPRL